MQLRTSRWKALGGVWVHVCVYTYMIYTYICLHLLTHTCRVLGTACAVDQVPGVLGFRV